MRGNAKAVKSRFGNRVRALRSARGWSQEDLAFRSGLDRSYIGGVERGARNVSLVNIHKIAAALETTPAELLQ